MTSPTQEVTGLARRLAIDIDMAAPGAAVWSALPAIEELKQSWDQRREGDESYDDQGGARETITGSSWKLELKLIHRAGPDGVTFNAVQEYLRGKAQAEDTINGEIHVRWYDRSGVGEAWDGRALVTWSPDGGNGAARDTVSVVISGQGKRIPITNPNASALPVVSKVTPTGGGVAGGNIVTIIGRKFTGTTGVTFGGTAATQVTVQSDTQIACLAPAKTAGTVDVIVTTAAGASANTAADNYIYA